MKKLLHLTLTLSLLAPASLLAETRTSVESRTQTREQDSGIPGAPIREERKDLEVKKETSDSSSRAQMNWEADAERTESKKETMERKEVRRDGFGHPEERTETKLEKESSATIN